MQYTPKDGFPYYYSLVEDKELHALFSSNTNFSLLQSIDDSKGNYRYATDKWSIKQIIGHITDHERIKMFRAFQLSRKEVVELWGYDQNLLVNNARFDELSVEQLLSDLSNVRQSSISFIASLSPQQLQIKGNARTHTITLQQFLKSIIGHEWHHINIIKQKYLSFE